MDKRFWLGLIFLLALSVRLFFAFQTESFTGDEAYFTLRQVEHIRDTGYPLFDDPLSAGGRHYLFLPLWHYVLAFFSIFMPVAMVGKLVPNIFACLSIPAVFLIVKRMTKDETAGILAAMVGAFMPIYLSSTLNSISPYSLSLPLSLFAIYILMGINIRKSPNYFILLVALLLLLDSTVYIVLIAFLLYLVLAAAQGVPVGKAETEVILFSAFASLWFYLVLFKQSLIEHGPSFIWSNIPDEIFNLYFHDVNVLQAIYLMGLVPVLAGLFIMVVYVFRRTKKAVYISAALFFSSSILIWLKLARLEAGLIFLGFSLCILFGEFVHILQDYLDKSKISAMKSSLLAIIMLLFVITSVPGALMYSQTHVQNSIGELEVLAMRNLALMSSPGDLVVVPPDQGYYIQYFSGRSTLLDQNFIGIDDIEKRLRDVRLIYTSAVTPWDILNQYGVDWIYFSEDAIRYYNITHISYLENRCFRKRYDNGAVQIYYYRCKR